MKTDIYVLVFIFCSIISNSQTIKGTVIDYNTKEPLIGVNVIISNTNGTTTDIDGKFNLTASKNENQITFKYIGYKTYTLILLENLNF